jgi:hypothetical protein
MTDTSPFDPDLAIAKQQIDERIAQHKREARRAIGKVAGHIDREEILPPERKQAFRSLTETLDQQIAGIESASHETLASARRQIGDGISKLKAELAAAINRIQSHPASSLHESAADCARAMDKLDAGLKAAEQHMASAVKKK